jgi:hypothetical protein
MVQRSRWPLPIVVNPPDHLCVLVKVPNDQNHIAAFLGAIYELTRPYSWQNDTAHTAIQAGAVWQPIFDALRLELCSAFVCPLPIDDWEDEMALCDQIRFQDGKLQVMCCGVWTDVTGQPPQGIGGGSQPGGGSGTPAAGTCRKYQGALNAQEQWLCPAVVSAGDTVQITKINGAWTDGGANWFCPTGTIFYAGLCTVGSGVDGGDPLPASPHMGLLSKIDGTFDYIGDLAIHTVPAGVSNKLLILQANDSSLTDDSGQITFEIEVCNNAPAQWTHSWNFALDDGRFVAENGSVSGHYGDWTPGTGWTSTDGTEPGPELLRDVVIDLPAVTAFHLLTATFTFNLTKGAYTTGFENAVRVIANQVAGSTDLITIVNPAAVSGDGQVQAAALSVAGVISLTLLVLASSSNTGGPLTGSSAVVALTITGDGPEPTWP